MQRKLIRQRHRKRMLRWSLVIILVLLFLTWFILFEARSPMRKARSEAFTIAEKTAGLNTDQKFFMSDLGKTYYTILGTDAKQQQRYVIIDKNNGKAVVENASSAISEERAVQIVKSNGQVSKILNAAPAINDNQPVWIISYLNQSRQLCYDTLSFNTGKSIQLITNI